MADGKYIQIRWMELLVAVLFGIVGLIVMVDSIRVGFGWADDGPQAGYFPFYIACILLAGAAVVIFQTLRGWQRDNGQAVFTGYSELRLVLIMLIPTVAFVVAMVFVGLYAASIAFIFGFMVWQGKYPVWKAAAVSVSVSAVIFALFEIWFLVPLPKGPIEHWLGY